MNHLTRLQLTPSKFTPLHVCFTDSFTEPSRTFTDAGNFTLYFPLHGNLHETFTDLHECKGLEKHQGKSENLLMRSLLDLHVRGFIAGVIYTYTHILNAQPPTQTASRAAKLPHKLWGGAGVHWRGPGLGPPPGLGRGPALKFSRA